VLADRQDQVFVDRAGIEGGVVALTAVDAVPALAAGDEIVASLAVEPQAEG
jgi:hypothetical protein